MVSLRNFCAEYQFEIPLDLICQVSKLVYLGLDVYGAATVEAPPASRMVSEEAPCVIFRICLISQSFSS